MMLEASTQLPTSFGTFTVKIYRNGQDQEVTAICSGSIKEQTDLAVRVHSACFTAETFGSLKCDCKQQLDYALSYIAENDGIVLYLPQEGRGIGLSNKIRAYALQEKGYDTIEANRMLGLPVDSRTYEDARDILNDLKVQSIRLLTNNPHKLQNLADLGIRISGRIPVASAPNSHSSAYLDTKQKQMGHMIKAKQQYKAPLRFPQRKTSKRPLVHVNFAIDSLARTASVNGEPIALSCEKDWQRVHELREKYSSIAVGANTWIKDTPRLTARVSILGRKPFKQPARVIFSGQHDCQPCKETNRATYVIGQMVLPLLSSQTHILSTDHILTQPLAKLNQLGIKSMLVEGGLQLIDSFIKQSMVDLLTIYVRSNCYTTAIKAALKAIPDLAADEISAQSYGEGTLLSVSFNKALINHPEYGIAI
ncbi:MAG: GTP cyclohydrolase II [Alcanivoracaceae bacterium]|nr:GTP cyclohydrolase II [Alcanivoracaceae bacterium]